MIVLKQRHEEVRGAGENSQRSIEQKKKIQEQEKMKKQQRTHNVEKGANKKDKKEQWAKY